MTTYGDLLKDPQLLGEFENVASLVGAASVREVLIEDSGLKPERTMVFTHETIAIMRAERVERLSKLRAVVHEASSVVPVRKRPSSFWDHVTVGRASTADIVFDDPAISNVHAHFIIDEDAGGAISLQDVGSSNGTFVNREPLQPHLPVPLATGDCVRFGQSVFYFVGCQALRDLVVGVDEPAPAT